MPAHSLLSRIREPSSTVARNSVGDEELRVAVLESLKLLLTARAGSALACPEYGMLSIVDIVHSCPDALDAVARSIRTTIERHEPRLAAITVRPAPHEPGSELTLRFEVAGQLLNGARRIPVRFETQINVARQLSVK
jgi:type VI secretion system lysozyme-like protein